MTVVGVIRMIVGLIFVAYGVQAFWRRLFRVFSFCLSILYVAEGVCRGVSTIDK